MMKKLEDAEEYFESANEPLAGSVAPQPKLVNNKPMKKKKKGAPQQANQMQNLILEINYQNKQMLLLLILYNKKC